MKRLAVAVIAAIVMFPSAFAEAQTMNPEQFFSRKLGVAVHQPQHRPFRTQSDATDTGNQSLPLVKVTYATIADARVSAVAELPPFVASAPITVAIDGQVIDMIPASKNGIAKATSVNFEVPGDLTREVTRIVTVQGPAIGTYSQAVTIPPCAIPNFGPWRTDVGTRNVAGHLPYLGTPGMIKEASIVPMWSYDAADYNHLDLSLPSSERPKGIHVSKNPGSPPVIHATTIDADFTDMATGANVYIWYVFETRCGERYKSPLGEAKLLYIPPPAPATYQIDYDPLAQQENRPVTFFVSATISDPQSDVSAMALSFTEVYICGTWQYFITEDGPHHLDAELPKAKFEMSLATLVGQPPLEHLVRLYVWDNGRREWVGTTEMLMTGTLQWYFECWPYPLKN